MNSQNPAFAILLIVLFLVVRPAQAQKSHFAAEQVFGLSPSLLWYGYDNQTSRFTEITLRPQAMLSISNHWYAGVFMHTIFTRSSSYPRVYTNYITGGAFLRGYFLFLDNIRVYGEGLYMKGNYCTCGQGDPYRKSNLDYGGLGAGLNWMIKDRWSLNLGLNAYRILNKVKDKFELVHYTIGLNYHLGRTNPLN